jgi:hypothetical protein
MISAWTKHLKSEEDKERFRNSVRGSKSVLDRQLDILKEMQEEVEALELTPKIYDIPNWEHRQADMNGYKRCLKQVSKLINLDQQDK